MLANLQVAICLGRHKAMLLNCPSPFEIVILLVEMFSFRYEDTCEQAPNACKSVLGLQVVVDCRQLEGKSVRRDEVRAPLVRGILAESRQDEARLEQIDGRLQVGSNGLSILVVGAWRAS